MNNVLFCDLCGGNTVEVFSARDYRRPSDNTEYSLRWCRQCAFGRIAGTFTHADVSEFFNIPYYTHGPNQMSKTERLAAPEGQHQKSFLDRVIFHLAWRVDKGPRLTADVLGPANNRRLCDLGCGDGQNLKRFSNAGFNVVGVEPDPVARAIASQFAEVLDGTVEMPPDEFSARRFDVVLLSHVLDICIDIRKSMSNIRSILSSTGIVIIEVPNFASKGFQIYGAEWPWTDIPRHLNFFTEKSLRLALKTGGFSVKKVQYLGYSRQFTPYWVASQAEIHSKIGHDKSHRRIPSPLWLARTAFSSDAKKYDSIRVLATLT